MFAGRKNLFVKSAVLLLLFLFFASAAFAAQGGEKSSSPGIPGQKPLSFVSITLVDGGGNVQDAADVPTEPKFKLEFDKNVVNSTIWGINQNCFSLFSENGENIPVSVTKVDDSIDFSQRNNVFVQPSSPLSPGTSYTLKVSPDLKAKNGVSVLGGTTSGQGLNISFKTQGQAISQAVTKPVTQPAAQTTAATQQPASPDSQPALPGEKNAAQANSETAQLQANAGGNEANTGQENKSPGAAAAGQQQVAGNTSGESAASGQTGKPESPAQAGMGLDYTNLLTILTVVLIAGWIVVELFVKKKKRS
ncbi:MULTISPECIES: Ig-like domain-containing protein [Pelotomaculum]|uniref:Ig-like domain-containing protein n=1 Tax=Pelotomaculum isophthalicicum JI TaxID=947010 RepID=A0A9X4JUM2_9FIRM|nr:MULTISPECIES: Ig-like domain-containing protein [Pelotomaculum]MDF9409520.1 Ig-like domain-containing protein [Pelotomaculum isophthalicicum JI]OPX91882.1 MAG: hypothetical protein A4E54_00118 [Pelotomaculum sp. PtaB.Bin117]